MSDTPTRYFSGKSVHGGRVRLLAAETFKDLVQSQIHVPVAFPMKRRDFLAHPDRDKLKDGAWLGAATYEEDECQRKDSAATGFNLIIIDLDGGPEAADFAQSPDTIREALAPYNFVAWTTAKHTPAEPRIKIMVDCLTAEPALFKRAVLHVIGLLGLPSNFKGKPESLIISQPQYRPLHFQGEDYNAVIGSRLDGKPLDPATVPDEDLAPEPGYAYTPTDADLSGVLGDLRFIPIQGITLEDIREPLYAIDPDHSYQRWYHIAAALRHNFTDEDEAREAFTLYDEWSSQGGKYRGADETLAKWRSFRPYPDGRNPITLRSLFSYAIESGWNHSKLTTRISDDFSSWCQQANSADLMGEGVRRIAVMPVRSDMGDELMADHIVKNMKRCGSTITKQAVLKDVRMHRRVDRAEKAKESKPSWMMPFCFIGPQDRFRNILTGVEYSVEAFNHSFSRHMIAPDEPTADGKAVMLPANYALNVGDIVIVDGAIYEPGKSPAASRISPSRGSGM